MKRQNTLSTNRHTQSHTLTTVPVFGAKRVVQTRCQGMIDKSKECAMLTHPCWTDRSKHRQIKTQVLYAMQSCTPVSDIIALHTFLRYIAFIFTHVQICQVALTRSTNELPDGWPETGVHESVDTVVYWVNNEGYCCSRSHTQ